MWLRAPAGSTRAVAGSKPSARAANRDGAVTFPDTGAGQACGRPFRFGEDLTGTRNNHAAMAFRAA